MSEQFKVGGEFVWQPTTELIQGANLTEFMRQHEIPNFGELMRRSTEDIAWYTDALL